MPKTHETELRLVGSFTCPECGRDNRLNLAMTEREPGEAHDAPRLLYGCQSATCYACKAVSRFENPGPWTVLQSDE